MDATHPCFLEITSDAYLLSERYEHDLDFTLPRNLGRLGAHT